MAETDSTRPSASGASRAEGSGDDATATGVGSGTPGAGSAAVDDGAAPDHAGEQGPAPAQRDYIPMRRAASLPEVPSAGADDDVLPGGSADEFDDVAEPDEPGEPDDTVDTVDTVETVDTVGTVDTVEPADTADTVDTAEPADTVDTAEPADTVDTAEPADTVETVDTADTADTVDTDAEWEAGDTQQDDAERSDGGRGLDQGPAGAPGASAVVAGPASSGAGPSGSGSHASLAAEPSADTAAEPSTDTAALSGRRPDREAERRAAARDQAVAAKPVLPRFLQVVVALFFPIIVVAAAIRAVATSSFLWLEYHRPGFPADRFGFSLDDRMTYGSYALDYVLNFAPPRYLGELVTPEGEPLFLESEVGHMADVKGVLGLSFFIALVLLVLSVLACIYLARHSKGGIRRALFSGAVLTLVGIAVLTVLAVLAWQTFFTQVHALFFADGTWTFRVDDTLIRLFPEQFWTDSALTVAVLVLAATILTLVLTWPTKARRDRSMMAQEAAQARSREALDAS